MSRVGPIVFSNRTARRQLLLECEVVTFRPSERTTGETWWRKSRTGEKMGDVVVEEIGKCNPARPVELYDHRRQSGFDSASKWQDAIIELHGGDLPHSGYLYRVRATEGVCGKCGETKPLPTNQFCVSCSVEEAKTGPIRTDGGQHEPTKWNEWALLMSKLDCLEATAKHRFSEEFEKREDWKEFEARYHVYKAHDQLSVASYHARQDNAEGLVKVNLADALNHMLMAMATVEVDLDECQPITSEEELEAIRSGGGGDLDAR